MAAAHSAAIGCPPDGPEAAAVAAAEIAADIAASECAVACTAIAAAEAASADPTRGPDDPTPACAVQCGCGVRGGASVLFRALQLGMEISPEGATAQADISNGFGEVSREAIFFGLSFLGLDSLIPVARSLYGTPGSLVPRRTDGIMHVEGEEVDSSRGTKQGCTLGALFFCVALHFTLVVTQAVWPSVTLAGYMDDVHTQHADPTCAWGSLCTFRTMSSAHCHLRSNLDKLAMYSPAGDLSFLPPSVPGSTHQPTRGLKIMGAYASCDQRWVSDQLCAMVPKKLSNLAGLECMHDTEKVNTSAQGKLLLLRHCANVAPSHWLQLTPPAAADAPARAHDAIIRSALSPIIRPHAASAYETDRALDRAALPLSDHGGLGIHSAHPARLSHFAGRFAADWPTVTTLFPSLSSISLTTSSDPNSPYALPTIVALGHSLEALHAMHASVTARYSALDSRVYDYDTFGDKTYQYHPPGLPATAALTTLTRICDPAFASNRRALHHFHAVTHHALWCDHLDTHRDDIRYTTVFICASQPHAGDYLHAIPTNPQTTIPTEHMECILQRRLGLPLFPPPPPPHDRFGDSLQNECNHVTRHDIPKERWWEMLVETYGSEYTICDPADESAMEYSPTHIPDVGVLYHSNDGKHLLGDTKVVNPFTSAFKTQVHIARAAAVAFANTGESMKELVLGRKAISKPPGTNKRFNRQKYEGSKVAVVGDYRGALALGHAVVPIVMEVFGGWGPDACKLFRQVARCHRDLLDPARTSWAARSFSAYHSQHISTAIHYSAAAEIVTGRRHAVAGVRRGMRQARAQRGGARRGRGGHTERALQPPTRTAAPALTDEHYPPLAAAARADAGAATTASGGAVPRAAGDASGGDAAAAVAHVRGGADGCAVA